MACNQRLLNAQAQASSCGHVGWQYDASAKSFHYGSQVTGSDDPEGSKYIYSLVTACDVNSGTGGICANFANCPPRVDPDGEPLRVNRFQGVRATRGPDGQAAGDATPYGEAICVYEGKSVPMADVVAAVRDELVKQVGRPTVAVQPATRGLVHWPMLFSAPAQHTTQLRIQRPLAGAITAVPTYVWDLGPGQTATGSGHRYAEAMDPHSSATDGYYVKGVYNRPGVHEVQVRLTWTATIHLGAGGGALDVDLDPIVFTAGGSATVVSATNRLYSSDAP
jgi:hypothetical protein